MEVADLPLIVTPKNSLSPCQINVFCQVASKEILTGLPVKLRTVSEEDFQILN